MRSRLEQVAEKIRMVTGGGTSNPAKHPSFSFGGSMIMAQGALEPPPAEDGEEAPLRAQTLEEAVSMCEYAASTFMDAFDSHQSTKAKIQLVEAEAAEQRQARERLETVAQRVDEAETDAAEERQARKQLEAKVRLAKNDCVRLAERLCISSGSQSQPPRTASIEDAIAVCSSATIKIETVLNEARRKRKSEEEDKNSALSQKDRQVKGLQAEIVKLRAELQHEKQLRQGVESSLLQGHAGSFKTSVHGGSITPAGSIAGDGTPDGDRLLYQGPAGRPPPKMHSVHENIPDGSIDLPSSTDLGFPSDASGETCKGNCEVM